ncbi:MAG TPA: hypothetical protein VGA06_02755 [Candidatus Paceibacterota bacterium]|jgi:hypothetical protein
MKKILTYIFVTLGMVLLLLILAGGYLYFFTPIGDIIQSVAIAPTDTTETSEVGTADRNPLLNEAQESALERIGVDPGKLPTALTSEMETCFIEKLGSERVNEIKAGDMPSPVEFFKVQSCL